MANNNGTTTQNVAFFDPGWLLFATIELFANYAVLAIALFGTAANALVFYALIVHNARETKKRVVNWLIINQNLLDLCCCITSVITLSIKVSNIYLTGVLGYILCSISLSGNAAYCFLNATVINLIAVTIERYLKVVYPFWSKKHLKSWMIHATIVFSWIAGILSSGPLGLVTSIVVDGVCLGFQLYFEDPEIKSGYGIWNFFSFFLLPLIVFVYCYGHIVVVMRKQMRVMAGHNVEGVAQSASQAQSKRAKWNVIKTMIIVSVFFTVCWCPWNIYITAMGNPLENSKLAITYMATLFLPYINISLNPFIYATKHEGVRRILGRMIICRKRSDVAAAGVAETSGTGSRGTKTTKMSVRPQ